ncbi:MAG: GFA family protein [Xanthomonadales bacterium]|nr:GFA family protein [Xanthomonadales bacterium]
MAKQSFEGTCQCHTIHFRIEAPTLWCAHCHCSMCRKAHGAAFVTWVGAAEEGFSIVTGGRALRWYSSSTEAERGFCSECGSTLFFRSERWPTEVHVALANIDEPIDRDPEAHVYYDSHVPWVDLGDDLPRKAGS